MKELFNDVSFALIGMEDISKSEEEKENDFRCFKKLMSEDPQLIIDELSDLACPPYCLIEKIKQISNL